MSLLSQKAETLAEAIKNLDHTYALQVDELERYFVSRDDRIIKRMGRNLKYDYPQKYLFTGHRGTGKSTELANFERLFDNDFFVILYSVEQVLDLFDITYVDVLLSIALEMLKNVLDETIDYDDEELEKIWSFGKDIEIEKDETRTRSMEGSVGLGKLGAALGSLFNISGRIGSETATRNAVREKVQYHISDLLAGIKMLAGSIEKATKKPVVCVVEDLDKADIETARTIFYDYGKSISAPDIAIIYTFPAALQHSDDFTQTIAYFGDSVTLPNFKVRDQQGEIAEGMDDLKQLLHARIVPELFSEDATERLIEVSGGIPRILLQLAKDAALEADLDDAEQVTIDHVRTALKRERRNFQRMLNREQLERLEEIKRDKTIDQTPQYQVLLHNLSVLEYTDGVEEVDVWYDINPLVDELLQ
ncbi:MAG: hypothetical protein AAF708_11145 [Deinococcota bacterium]